MELIQYSLMNHSNLRQVMTKNLGNALHTPAQVQQVSVLGKVAPALFPLVVAALGYMIGRQFFGI